MNTQQVLQVYDREYAERYENQFLFDDSARPKYELEVDLMRRLVRPDDRWLDVACGTGHFLSLFPGVRRAGLDLSPGMLEVARRANPGVDFTEGDFRQPRPAWENAWTFVSCMWYAYCLVETTADIRALVRNLAAWTAPEGGRCFLPLFHPEKACKTVIPYDGVDFMGGHFRVTGIIWNFVEPDGKTHDSLISPQTEYMVELFEPYFESVEVITYHKERVVTPFKAILASGKRAPA